MKKAQRLIALMMAVNSRKQFTVKEMAREFDVSERTMHRDLQELADLGMPLYTEFGPHGGFRLLKKRLLPPILFSEEEAVAIFFAVQSLQGYGTLPFAAETSSALRKFYHSLPDDAKKRIDELQDRIAFWTPLRMQDSPYLQLLLEASLEQRPLALTYASRSGTTARTVQPIGLYAQNGYWYFPAFCFVKAEILLFRIDRIQSLEPAEQPPGAASPQLTLTEWLRRPCGAEDAASMLRLRVRLTPEGARQCERNTGFAGSVRQGENDGALLETEMHPANLAYFGAYFLSLGAHAVVEEPAEMVAWLKEQAQALHRAYSSPAASS